MAWRTLARKLGLAAEVEKAVQRIVPRILGEVESMDPVSFPESGNAYEEVRYALAPAIAGAQRKP